MERYINSYATENDIQIALQNGELFKPYVAYIEDVDRIDWNSKEIVDYTTEYLTFNILSAGTINWTANSTGLTKTIDYKLNNGEWTSITSNTGSSAPSITVNSGDKLQFRGNNAQYATNSYSNYNLFSSSTASFELEGNIMSLIYGDNFKNNLTISSTYAFFGLFRNCTKLVSAENLILPATNLANWCYESMFEGCTKLTTAPVLPATKLAPSCYNSMFQGCTSLTTAPELPATTLARSCYSYMFKWCRSLNYIKCLATDISASACTEGWVDGVASTGTFVKAPSMTSWTTDIKGIPTGWAVQDA